MKALSLRQPWANAVLHLGKRIENRKWHTSFEGEFLIHAAKGMTLDEWGEATRFCIDVLGRDKTHDVAHALDRRTMHRGGIVGRAHLTSVITPRGSLAGLLPSAFYMPDLLVDDVWKWHMPEQFGFVLEKIEPLPFVPWKGELGFFEVPDDYAARATSP